jgi:hypothetical protein
MKQQEFQFVYNIVVQWEGADRKVVVVVVVVKFMTVFVKRRDSACSWLRVVTVSPL